MTIHCKIGGFEKEDEMESEAVDVSSIVAAGGAMEESSEVCCSDTM